MSAQLVNSLLVIHAVSASICLGAAWRVRHKFTRDDRGSWVFLVLSLVPFTAEVLAILVLWIYVEETQKKVRESRKKQEPS